MLRSFATKALYVVSATVVASTMAAQVNAQTIIVDGVTYQAVNTAPAVPAPQVQYAAPTSYPTAPVYSAPALAAPEQTYANPNLVIPLFMALGLWAANDWFKPEMGYRQHRPLPAPVPRYHHPR